jgi:hypothetical protein
MRAILAVQQYKKPPSEPGGSDGDGAAADQRAVNLL